MRASWASISSTVWTILLAILKKNGGGQMAPSMNHSGHPDVDSYVNRASTAGLIALAVQVRLLWGVSMVFFGLSPSFGVASQWP